MRIMQPRAIVALALLAGAAAPPALADSASTEAIVRSLKPLDASGPTRGIRPIGPVAGDAVNHAAARAVTPTSSAGRPAVSLNVEFASGSDELGTGAERTLDALGRALTGPELSAYKFRIDGHTDTVGPDDMNKGLSERRAQAVARYLADKFQVADDRMEIVGSGKQGLAVQTGDNVAEARNRRVEVVNLGS